MICHKGHRALTVLILLVYFLVSINCLLPAKIRFPTWRTSYNLRKINTETDDGIRIDFVNSHGSVVTAVDLNYSTVFKTLDENGNCIKEKYLDSNGNPAVLVKNNSAVHRVFNDLNQCVYVEYLDQYMHPIELTSGYASACRMFNEEGQLEEIRYFDRFGIPTTDNLKRYGIHYVYNDDGQKAEYISIDADGNIMNTVKNFAISKRTYYPDGSLRTVMFYDKNGDPSIVPGGYSGYLYENGKTKLLDKDGNEVFFLRHYLTHSFISVILFGILLLLLIKFGGRNMNFLLLALYLVFIAYMTLMLRENRIGSIDLTLPPNLYLFCTNKEIINNIWLFIPLGAILYRLSNNWKIAFIPVLLSLVIETLQYLLNIGLFDLTDLIANSLGGILGIMLCDLINPPLYNKRAEKVR